MGCICVKNAPPVVTTKKVYTWETRDYGDIKDYRVENADGFEIIKQPGSVNGEQFLIQNCLNTRVFIFDHIGAVTVDDCRNCTFIFGAVKSSVFLRNCVDVVCVTSCGQFRSRDCAKCHIFISSATQPIIETSTEIRFSALSLSYSSQQTHRDVCALAEAKFWTEIFDFTPTETGLNWSIIRLENVHFKLEARSQLSKNIFKDLAVCWLGKTLINDNM